MGKLIIDNRTDMPMDEAIHYALHVVLQGRMSNDGKQYCYASTWRHGISVVSYLNEKSDRLVIDYCTPYENEE